MSSAAAQRTGTGLPKLAATARLVTNTRGELVRTTEVLAAARIVAIAQVGAVARIVVTMGVLADAMSHHPSSNELRLKRLHFLHP